MRNLIFCTGNDTQAHAGPLISFSDAFIYSLKDGKRESERALEEGSEFESENRKNKEIRMKNDDERTKRNSFEGGKSR